MKQTKKALALVLSLLLALPNPVCTAEAYAAITADGAGIVQDELKQSGEELVEKPVEAQADAVDESAADESEEGAPEAIFAESSEDEAKSAPFLQSATVDDVTVTVSAPSGAFPENAILSVEKVPDSRASEAGDAVEDARAGDVNVAISYTFDIKVIDPETGEEIQPAEGFDVEVSFASAEVADQNLETSVYHIQEEKDNLVAEALDIVDESGDTVTTVTDSFSLYTVEFTYNELQYVLEGDKTVALADILEKVGLTGEVEAVSVSNEELFVPYQEDGTWYVKSLLPFESEEWMRVRLHGIEYVITVTDDFVEELSYVDAQGNQMEPKRCRSMANVWLTEIIKGYDSMDWHNNNGWYYLDWSRSPFICNLPLVVEGDINLVICSGTILTLFQGLYITEGSSLTIWNQYATDDPGLIKITNRNYPESPGVTGWEGATNGKLVVNGGWLDIETGEGYAGIGSGPEGTGGLGEVIINGGKVITHGGESAAGIGGGKRNYNAPKVTITGGKVYAEGGDYGAGIGGGEDRSGNTVTITGGDITAIGGKYAAGIGGGDEGGGSFVSITGIGTKLVAESGGHGSCAIGNGDDHDDKGLLTIGDGLEVQAGNDGKNYERVFTAGERVSACQYRYNALIQECQHNCSLTYGDIRPETHSATCSNCNRVLPDEPHVWTDGHTPCSLCGYKGFKVSFDAGGAAGSMEDVYVIPGTDYPLPSCGFDQPGLSFAGWKVGDKILQKDETYTISEDTTFTALWDMPKVPYVDANDVPQDPVACKLIVSEMAGWTLDGGWYVAFDQTHPENKTIALDDTLRINGNVNLILHDDVTLYANKGIVIPEGSTLTIWEQAGHSGKLVAKPESGPGIGGPENALGGRLIINGGQITANGGSYAAGIGGGKGNDGGFSYIEINGENTVVEATGGERAAGIGSGQKNSHMGTIRINGGDVTAQGGGYGAGIGGGEECSGGLIYLNGGTVKATGGKQGAGIGGGREGLGGTIVINEGTITAGGDQGAGIGGGYKNHGGDITICGGDITANGKNGGAGIGGGYGGNSGTLTISGGTVDAFGQYGSSAIGAGRYSGGIDLTISGGTVTATTSAVSYGPGIGGGYSADTWGQVTISGGTVNANGGDATAGIGGSYGHHASGLAVNISGGEVNVTSHGSSAGIGSSEEEVTGEGGEGANVTITGGIVVIDSEHTAIGHGGTDNVMGTLTLGDGMKVYAGNDGTHYERAGKPFSAAERVAACQYRNDARIEPCDHPDNTFHIDENGHEQYCDYCTEHFEKEEHDLDKGNWNICKACGYQGPLVEVELKSNTDDDLSETEKAVPGTYFILPGRRFDPPEYMEFDGWIVKQDGEETILPEKERIFVTDDTVILAHYKPVQVTVSFDPGKGTGEKESVKVDANTDYPLPGAYGFTEPEMMAFKGWQLPDGSRKSPEESIHVTEDITVQAVYLSEWQMLQEAVSKAKEGDTIVVDGEFAVNSDNKITALAGDDSLRVPSSITIDLGGYILDQTNDEVTAIDLGAGVTLTIVDSEGGGGVAANNADVVVVHADNKLVLEGGDVRGGQTGVVVDDGKFEMSGGTISGNTQGGVSVAGKHSQFVMTGGAISGNTAAQGGGVRLSEGALFAMEGGKISGNTAVDTREDAQPSGGGVSMEGDCIFYLRRDGSITGNSVEGSASALGGGVAVGDGLFVMTGGTISGNTADAQLAYGGGVYMGDGNSRFTMTGGTISENSAATAAGGVYHGDGTFAVSGAPTIKENTAGDVANNVYLKDKKVITVDGKLTEASIGVSTESKPEEKEDVVPVTNETDPSYVERFISDDASYETIALNPDAEQSEIVLKIQRFRVTEGEVEHGSLTIHDVLAYEGDTVLLTVTAEEDWFVDAVRVNYTDYYFPGGQERVTSATHLEGDEYSFTMPASDAVVDVVFAETYPTMTAPTAIEGLVYNGTDQNLINAGTSDCGTMEYQVRLLETDQPDDHDWSEVLPAKKHQGTYYVWYRVKGEAPYVNSDPQRIPVTIAKAPLKLTANDVTIEYGIKPVDAGVTAEGLQNDEALETALYYGRLTYQIDYPYEKEQIGDAGEYAITPVFTPDPNNADRVNYEVTCVPGKLIVNPMKVTVTAHDGIGADNPDVSEMKYSTFNLWFEKDAESLNVHLELGEPEEKDGVKTYPIRVVYNEHKNYDITTHDGVYTVVPSISFNAVGYEGVYDGQLHGITIEVTGAKVYFGESEDTVNLEASPQYSDAGTHVVFYEVRRDNGVVVQRGSKSVTIAQKSLAVTADDKSITYGEADPEFTYTAEGLVEGDDLTCTLKRTPQKDDAGSYDITKDELNITRGSLSVIDNYDVVFKNGTLTIGKAPSVITEAPKAKVLTYTGKAQELVSEGATDDGDLLYSLSQDGTFEKAVPTGTNAGSHTVFYQVRGDGNHTNSTVQGPIKVTIEKAAATVTLPSANELTYTGDAQKLVSGGKAEGGTIAYSLGPDGPFTKDIPSGTNAGGYEVYCKAVGDKNHSDSAVDGPVKVTIKKAASVITLEPKAKDLTYTGSVQALVSKGETNDGVVKYSLSSDGPFSESVPTAVDAGDYTVYYKVVGDSNHNDSAVGSVKASIGKAETWVTAPTADRLTYNGSEQKLVKAGSSNAGKMEYSLNEEGLFSETVPSGIDAGEYTVYYRVQSDRNHEEAKPGSLKVTIQKAQPTVTAPTAKDLTYTGSPQALVEGGSADGGTLQYSLDNKTWSAAVPNGTDAGTYTVYYRVLGDGNHKDVAARQLAVSIKKATSVIEKAPEGGNLRYNGKAQKLVTEGTAAGGSMRYSLDNKIWRTTIPVATDAGTYTVFYQAVGDENHTNTDAQSLTATISQAAIQIAAKDDIGPDNPDASKLEYEISGDLVKADEPGLAVTLSLGEADTSGGPKAYPIIVSYTSNDNYEITTRDGLYIVNEKLVCTVNGFNGEYDGQQHGIEATISSGEAVVYSADEPLTTPADLNDYLEKVGEAYQPFAATDAGTYTVYYAITGSGEYISGSDEIVITPKTVKVFAEAKSKTFGKTDPALSYQAEGLLGKDALSGKLVRDEGEDVGTYAIRQGTLAVPNSNYELNYAGADFTIKKAESSITGASTAKTLTYTGQAQELVTKGKANGGTVQYALGKDATTAPTEGWGAAIPAKTDAGTYYVWYKVAGDNNHKDTDAAVVTATINKAKLTKVTLVRSIYTYTGEGVTAGIRRVEAGTIEVPQDAYTVSGQKATEPGKYTVKAEAKEDGNFEGSATTDYHVVDATGLKLFEIVLDRDKFTYTGEQVCPNVSVIDVASGDPLARDTYTLTYADNIDATNAAKVQVTGPDGYVGLDGQRTQIRVFTILKAPSAVKAAPEAVEGLKYSGEAQGLVTAGTAEGGTMQYALGQDATTAPAEGWGKGVPTGTEAGTYYVWYKIVGDDNHNDTEPACITNKIRGEISQTVTFKVVNGSWDDGTTEDKVATLASHEGDELRLEAEQIPAVGGKPNDMYKAGSWDVKPSTDTPITKDTTYTYTYAENDKATVVEDPTANDLTYNGSAQELVTAGKATGGTMYYALGQDATTAPTEGWGEDVPTATDAGSYHVWYKVVGDKDHRDSKASCVDASIKAIAEKVTVQITGHQSTANYDGREHTASGYDVTSISNPLYTEDDIAFAGDAEAGRTDVIEGEDADGRTDMGLLPQQFSNTNVNFTNVEFSVTDGWQEIRPVDDEVIVAISGRRNASVYDGLPHEVIGYDVTSISNPLYTEDDIAFAGDAEAGRTNVAEGEDADGRTDMGLLPQQFSNTSANFSKVTFAVADGWQAIVPSSAIVIITGHHDAATYDGTEHAVEGYDVEASNPLYTEDDFAFSGTARAARTDQGTTYMDLSADQFANESRNFDRVNFVVTDGFQAVAAADEVIVTITGHTSTDAYDGKEHKVSGYDVETSNELYTEADFTFSGEAEATRTNAGIAYMGLDADQFENINDNFSKVTFQVIDGFQTVAASPLTITAGSASKAYDGTALTCPEVAVEGLAEGDVAEGITVTGSQTEVGTSANVASGARVVNAGGADITDSYVVAYVDGTLEVTKASIAEGLSVSIEGWTYGEEANEPTVTGNLGNGKVTYEYATKGGDDWSTTVPTAYGDYTMRATVSETSNYLGGTATVDFTIKPVEATLTFDLAGGTLNGKTGKVTVTANVGDTVKLPSAPTRSGYVFQYWKGSSYAAGAEYKVEGDHSFTAVWEKSSTTNTTGTNSTTGTTASSAKSGTTTTSTKASTTPKTGDPTPLAATAAMSAFGLASIACAAALRARSRRRDRRSRR